MPPCPKLLTRRDRRNATQTFGRRVFNGQRTSDDGAQNKACHTTTLQCLDFGLSVCLFPTGKHSVPVQIMRLVACLLELSENNGILFMSPRTAVEDTSATIFTYQSMMVCHHDWISMMYRTVTTFLSVVLHQGYDVMTIFHGWRTWLGRFKTCFGVCDWRMIGCWTEQNRSAGWEHTIKTHCSLTTLLCSLYE